MKKSIPLKYRIRNPRYCGAPESPKDNRRIILGDVPFVKDPKTPSWEIGFDLEVKYGKLARDHQGTSLSCVGQAWSKYGEMLDLIETGVGVNLSARYLYSQMFLKQGGAYISSGAKLMTQQGVAQEPAVPSYESGGKYPSEAFMRKLDGVVEAMEEAKTYKAKKYIWIDADDITDDMRYVIYKYGGFVSGLNGHCVFILAYGTENGRKYIDYLDSYGVYGKYAGRNRIYEGSGNRLYDITFLMDLPNNWHNPKIDMIRTVKLQNDNRVYAEIDGDYYWITSDRMYKKFIEKQIVAPFVEVETIETSRIIGTFNKEY